MDNSFFRISLEYGNYGDADPGQQDPVLWLQETNTQDKYNPTKGLAQPLPQEESAPTLALAGFYCFSEHKTLRMVLIYNTQVRFRWLQKTKERMLLITSKRKDIYKCKGKSG